MPLALAIGPGSGIQQPLALSIIAGLLLQFPTVLLAMPVLISFTVSDQRMSTFARRQTAGARPAEWRGISLLILRGPWLGVSVIDGRK